MKTFWDFCRRYNLDPNEPKSWEDYELYSRQLEIFQGIIRDRDEREARERNQPPQRNDEP